MNNKNRTEIIMSAIASDLEFRERLKARENPNNDTTIRMDIHKIMQTGVESGKNKEEIIASLSQEERFLKYENFFESWIDDKMKKYKTVSGEER